jgi:uncharacterized protein with GYD domain
MLLIGGAGTVAQEGGQAKAERKADEKGKASGTLPVYPRSQTMPMYLTRFSYTPETWARLTEHPEDRRDAARSYIESVGGKLHGFWYAFGEYDGYTLWEAPDNVAMSAVSVALSGGGALSKAETTVLLTVEETLEGLKRAKTVRYRPPGK